MQTKEAMLNGKMQASYAYVEQGLFIIMLILCQF